MKIFDWRTVLDVAKDRSAVLTVTEHAVKGSQLLNLTHAGQVAIGARQAVTCWNHSVLVTRVLLRASRSLERVGSSPVLLRCTTTTTQWLKASIGYRWLTTDPEPERVVVDFEDTRIVWPFIALFDRGVGHLSPRWSGSHMSDTFSRVSHSVHKNPIRIACVTALAAVAIFFSLGVSFGTLSTSAVIAVAAVVIAVTAGLRRHSSLAELQESRLVRRMLELVEPPEFE